MECPDCHREHSAIAVYCPHCGATLPTAPAREVASEAEGLSITAGPGPAPGAGRQRTATKILVPIVTVIVVASGFLTYVTRRQMHKAVNTVDTSVSSPLQTSPGPVVTSTEDAVYNAALQYASTQGEPGLERDGVNITGTVADAWLKDPATGMRYRVSLFKTGDERGWIATGIEGAD